MIKIVDKSKNMVCKRLLLSKIKIGKRQIIDALISKEALLFAKYLRNEEKNGCL